MNEDCMLIAQIKKVFKEEIKKYHISDEEIELAVKERRLTQLLNRFKTHRQGPHASP